MMEMGEAFVDEEEAQKAGDLDKAANITHSFSGSERNRLFLNNQAEQFVDVSGISGVDSPADGRVFVTLDYDRDGWQDIAVINSNRPLLQIFHNEIPASVGNNSSDSDAKHRESTAPVIAIRLVGGNTSDQPSREFSARDAYGTKVVVEAGELHLFREHRCGDGLAAQNSATMLIGMGENAVAKNIEIRWSSGKSQKIENVAAGSLLTVFENPVHSPHEKSYVVSPYIVTPRHPTGNIATKSEAETFGLSIHSDFDFEGKKPSLFVFTTMATWCVACRQHQPQLVVLSFAFPEHEVQFIGVPIDPNDSVEMLNDFDKRHKVAYHIATSFSKLERSAAQQFLLRRLKTEALPATIVTDSAGNVLLTKPGIPNISELRQYLLTVTTSDD